MSLPLPQEPYYRNGYHPYSRIEVPTKSGFPLLHVVLFLTTLVTTSMAGAFQQGADPFNDPAVLLLGLPFAATLMAILLFHEMGHYILARIHGIRATLPYFIPAPPPFVVVGTFGAFIRMKSPPNNRRALFDVGAAGPWAGVFLAIPAAMLGLSLSEVRPMNPFDEGGIILGDSFLFSILTRLVLGVASDEVSIVLHPIALAGWFGLFVTFLNLLPVGQLDGGHVIYSLFGRWHGWISRGALAAILLLGFYGWVGWFVWVVLLSMLGVNHPPTLDLTSSLDPRRKLYAWCTVGLFILTFMPVPISLADRPARPTGEVTHIAYRPEPSAVSNPFTFVYRP
jgi:membrane-associated protease RseP (regulator of RpoE activity)